MLLGTRIVAVAVGFAVALCSAVGTAGAAFTTFETGEVRPLAMSPDTTRLFVANTPDNRLEIFSVDGSGLTHTGSVQVGLEPCAVAARSNSEVWVVNHLSDSISIVDVAASPPRVVRTLLVGDEPRDIVFAGSSGNRAFITTAHRGQNNPNDPQLTTASVPRADVWVFDATNLGNTLGGTPLNIINLFGDTPRALAVTPDRSTVYAAVFHSGNRTTALPEGVVCDTDSTNLNNNTVQGACTVEGVGMPGGLPLPHRNFEGFTRPETGLMVKFNGTDWVDQLGRNWDSAVKFSLPDKDVFTINANGSPPAETAFHTGVGTILFNMAVNPVSGKVYVSNGEARNEVRFEGPGVFGGSTVQGHLAEYRITVLDGASVLPRHLNKHIPYGTLPAPAGVKPKSLATPMEMAVTSDGQTLYVAAFGSSKVGIFNTGQLEADTFTPNSANHIAVSGGGPSGLVLDEGRSRLYVLTRFDNSVSVIDTGSKTEIAHLPIFNPEPPSVVQGRPFLYDAVFTSSNGEASCSSCHIFGDFDSLAWDLGNPDDVQIPNPFSANNIKLKQVAQIGGTDVDFDHFHPMKGPMTTQTLRGMAHHGAMHWRGDRVDQGGDLFNEDIAFRNFRVAFPGLVGRDSQIPESDMQKFSDFVLQVMLPPNPIRALDNSLTSDQQAGRNFMTGSRRADGVFAVGGFGFNCVGCHTLDNAQSFFGTDGQQSFEGEPQILKIAHLRNMYQKVGMFGMAATPMLNNGDNGNKGPQVRGTGFLHDGSVDTVFRFLQADVFNDGGTFNPVGFQNDTQRRQVEQFVLAFDSDLFPIVGQQVTLTDTNNLTVASRIALLIARTAAGDCDLIVKGTVSGEQRGWYRLGNGNFRSDRASEPELSDASLRLLATVPGQQLTYTAVPPGNGVRIGVDRDEDGFFDQTEIDAGSDPANSASTPNNIPTATTTATITGTPSLTATNTSTVTPTSTSTATGTNTSIPVGTATNTATRTGTNTGTATSTATGTRTNTATVTTTPTPVATATATMTVTPLPATPTNTPTFTPAVLCGPAPRSGCSSPGKALLIVKDKGGSSKKLTWHWLNGDVPLGQFGHPGTSTRYALCVYDETGQTPALAVSIQVAAGNGWSTTSSGFRYKDSTGSQQGAQKLQVKGGKPGHDKLLVKAGGGNLILPGAASASQYFNQQDDVTVQLVNDTGACFETVFTPSAAAHNAVKLYKGKF